MHGAISGEPPSPLTRHPASSWLLTLCCLARRKTPLGMGGSGGNFKLKSATVKSQPGDGSCLFHSLAYGLGDGHHASNLRREIANFVSRNPNLEIAETPLHEWVKWDSGKSVANYANSISVGGWGGGIEMAACSLLKKVNVHGERRINDATRESNQRCHSGITHGM